MTFSDMSPGILISVLTRIFGSENLEMAEDVVQDALIKALNQFEQGTKAGIESNKTKRRIHWFIYPG